MDQILAKLQSKEFINDTQLMSEIGNQFEHLSPQTAPRLKKDFESFTLKSHELLGGLFDHIDLSNKPLLCNFLRTLVSFGYFRIAQITYHNEGARDEFDPNPIFFPAIAKNKWYDMGPLLPEAGTLGWKGLMNHGLVKEESELLQVCLQLLSQKLHFYSIIMKMNEFQDESDRIRKNGVKVAEKLFEIIRDVAYDDESMIGIDSNLFNLLSPFINSDQQTAIIDAAVQDLFKPFLLQKPVEEQEMDKLYGLINSCVMNKSQLQSLIVTKLLEHLRCNIIRRKRRHSIESSQESCSKTIESIVEDITKEQKLHELLPQVDSIEIAAKSFQTGYVAYWIDVINRVLPQRAIAGNNSMRITNMCAIILVVASNIISQDLIDSISSLMARVIQNTSYNNDKLMKSYNPSSLIQLTKILHEKTSILSTFDSPIQSFYKSYIGRYFRICAIRGAISDAELMTEFVSFICDKNLGKEASYLLQYVCMSEIADCLESSGHKHSSKMLGIHIGLARTCSKSLHKFIKRNVSLRKITPTKPMENGHEEESELNSSTDCQPPEVCQTIAIDALVCLLRIAIGRRDQEMLDTYGDLIVKLFGVMVSRIEKLVDSTRTGSPEKVSPLDSHLSKLLSLYISHKDMIEGYLNYDLFETISTLLMTGNSMGLNSHSNEQVKAGKKLIYNQLKTKLETLEERAQNSMDVYPTIINKQYTTVVNQSLSSISDIKKEKFCCQNYWHQMKIVHRVSTIILGNCGSDIYAKVLESTVYSLEQCDPLDHPKVLHLLLMLESLILKQAPQSKDTSTSSSFKEILPRISCSLIRITKTVELGPSIHSFSRSGAHRSNKGVQCCTYANCIKIYNLVFLRFSPKLTNPLITDAMQICVSSNLIQYAKYSSRLHRFFIQLASSIGGLLRAICIGRKEEEILKSSVPIFLSVFSHLIRCIILASDRQKLQELPRNRPRINGHSSSTMKNEEVVLDIDPSENYETQLELLALDIGRTLNNLSRLRVKLIDYAPHIISAYIKDIQRASCPDFVKIHLDEGIFRIFNLVDAHQKERQEEIIEAGIQRKTVAGRARGSLFEMVHARLDQASREIFRDLHDNYNKFHRYLGKC